MSASTTRWSQPTSGNRLVRDEFSLSLAFDGLNWWGRSARCSIVGADAPTGSPAIRFEYFPLSDGTGVSVEEMRLRLGCHFLTSLIPSGGVQEAFDALKGILLFHHEREQLKVRSQNNLSSAPVRLGSAKIVKWVESPAFAPDED